MGPIITPNPYQAFNKLPLMEWTVESFMGPHKRQMRIFQSDQPYMSAHFPHSTPCIFMISRNYSNLPELNLHFGSLRLTIQSISIDDLSTLLWTCKVPIHPSRPTVSVTSCDCFLFPQDELDTLLIIPIAVYT